MCFRVALKEIYTFYFLLVTIRLEYLVRTFWTNMKQYICLRKHVTDGADSQKTHFGDYSPISDRFVEATKNKLMTNKDMIRKTYHLWIYYWLARCRLHINQTPDKTVIQSFSKYLFLEMASEVRSITYLTSTYYELKLYFPKC